MVLQYGLEFKAQKHLTEVEQGFLGALYALVTLTNCCIAYATSDTSLGEGQIVPNLDAMAHLMSGAMKAINGKEIQPDFGSTMEHLCKFIFIFYKNYFVSLLITFLQPILLL